MEIASQAVSDGFAEVMRSTRCLDKPMQEIMNTGFFIVDRNWTIIHWNKVAENLLATGAKDVVGFNLWGVCGMAIPEKFYSVYHEAFLHEDPKENVVLHWAE